MKKVILFVLLILLFTVNMVMADWSVTTTWDRSIGPDLDYEELLLDGVLQCTVQETETTAYTYIVTDLLGQILIVRSYNSQGGYSDATSQLINAPAAATGISNTIVHIP